jgi:hypothetical protein
MALDFPSSPTIGDTYAYGGRTWEWNGAAWEVVATGIFLTDGDKGDITVSSSGAAWSIDDDAVTFAKIQNIASNKLLGRNTVDSGNIEEISIGAGLSLSGGTLSGTAEPSVAASVSEVISVAAGAIGAVDAGSDKLVFWDDSTGALRYCTLDANSIVITGTTISALGGGGGGGGISLSKAVAMSLVF